MGDISPQRLGLDGSEKWASNGIAVCDDPGIQLYPEIVPDGLGEAIVI